MSIFKEINSKTIFEQLPIASWIVDADTLKIMQINETAAELYGYSKDEFKKLHVWDLDATEDKKGSLRKAKKLRKLKYFSFKTKHKTKHKTKNNKILDVTVSISLISMNGKDYFNVTCQNNSYEVKVESKLDYIEKKFEFFFNQLPEAILILDKNLEIIINANKAATELFGYPESELHTMNFSSLMQIGQDTQNCKDIIKYNLENNKNFFERKIKNKEGKNIDALVSFRELNSPYGLTLIITWRDITSQKHAEYQLLELNESLKKNIDIKTEELQDNERLLLEQSKLAQMGEMLNMIAHQWRQPLNSISAAALNFSFQNELGLLDTQSIDDISKFIQSETHRMSQIINDFMEFNKSDINKEFLIYKAIKEVEKLITPQLKNVNITLDIDVDEKLMVFHNMKSIEHILLNLITNAKDAFENKKEIKNKKIKIYSSVSDEHVTLDIEDNAGGIKYEIINKIFNPYFTTKEQGKGTGIGLYMSKRLVEGVDGASLSVKNSTKGAIFSIAFKKKTNQ